MWYKDLWDWLNLDIMWLLLIINQLNRKIFLSIFLISVLNTLNAEDWSSVFRQVEKVTLNEGLDKDYVDLEGFWKTIKENHVKEGMQIGWFVWKVDQSSNENNAWSD